MRLQKHTRLFCPKKAWNPLAMTEIYGSLEGQMLELFRVTKSHLVAKAHSRRIFPLCDNREFKPLVVRAAQC